MALTWHERNHDDPDAPGKIEPNLLYYLGRGAARLAILQLLAAGLLLAAIRRF